MNSTPSESSEPLNFLLVVLPFANACVRHIFKAIMLRNIISEKMRSITISDDFVKDNEPLLTILAVSRLDCSTLYLRLTFRIINYLRSTVSSTFLDQMDRYQRNMTDSTVPTWSIRTSQVTACENVRKFSEVTGLGAAVRKCSRHGHTEANSQFFFCTL
jgi:hypothetical protein